MAIDGHRSTFPTTVDVLTEYQDLSPSEVISAARWQELKLKASKTSEEIAEFNSLTTQLASKIFTPESLNKIQDIMYQLETFFKSETEGYITTKQAEFNATLQKFSNKGLWSNLTTYQQWNTVSYDNETYMSLQDNNLNHIPVGDVTDVWFQKVALRGSQGQAGVGLSFTGNYNNATAYSVGNAVYYNNSIYYCTNASTGNLPTNTTYWTIFLSNSGISVQSSAPTEPYLSQIFIDSSTTFNNIKFWNGSAWQICGVPASQVSIADSENIITATDVEAALQEIVNNFNAHLNKSSSVSDQLITTTSATNVLVYTPTAQGNFNIGIYFRVITGTTNVTVAVSYTDNTGVQTNTLLSAQSCQIGSYSTLPVFINAKTTGAITITVTASVASRVYVSASIEGV